MFRPDCLDKCPCSCFIPDVIPLSVQSLFNLSMLLLEIQIIMNKLSSQTEMILYCYVFPSANLSPLDHEHGLTSKWKMVLQRNKNNATANIHDAWSCKWIMSPCKNYALHCNLCSILICMTYWDNNFSFFTTLFSINTYLFSAIEYWSHLIIKICMINGNLHLFNFLLIIELSFFFLSPQTMQAIVQRLLIIIIVDTWYNPSYDQKLLNPASILCA